MIFKVDVQPFAACRAGTIRGESYKLCPDPAPADPGGHESVEQEGVDTPIPGNVDEARKLPVFPRADPAQAVPAHLALPVIIQEPMTEAFGMQGIQFGVRERAAPRVIDHRATLRSHCNAQLLVFQLRRALRCAILTGLLVGVYAGLVLLATQVLKFHSTVAVAASTLVAAALFNPVRRRVQHAVDRRFNRARYNAEQMVAAFAARLQDAVDSDAVRADLTGVIHTALEPTHMSVWLGPGERH